MPSPLVRKCAAPALTLSLLLGVAYVQALALTRVVATALLPPPRGLAQALAPTDANAGDAGSAEPKDAPHETSAARLLERNPFDSTRGSLLPPPEPLEPAGDDPPRDLYAAPACPGVTVLATAAGDDASRSFALLGGAGGAGGGAGAGVVRQQGDEYDGKQVWLVAWDRVWLRSPRSLCQAAMFAPAPEAPPTTARAKPAPGHPSVRQRGPGTYDIEPKFLDMVLENQAELMRSVRAKPESVDGQIVGLRVQSIRPDSPLAALGIAAGDRIESINGFRLGSPTEALEAYAKLR
ncbi:MAG TPA: type II secretion system protein GspC, partial [Polyangiaceae bacterium]|nr:type II secretion system protein GspC [Polyangiaceae bacterium]